MKKAVSFISVLFIISCLLLPVENEPNGESFSPQSAVLYALEHNAISRMTALEKQKAQLIIREIRSKYLLPEFTFSLQTGLVPEARGDIFSSPDKQTDLDGWGPYIKFHLTLMQPIFTFGHRTAAIETAEKGVEFQDLLNRSALDEFILKVIQVCHAVQASDEGVKIARDLKENFDTLEEEVKKRLLDEDSEVDDTDLLEVQSNRFYIEEILIKSQTQQTSSRHGLNVLLGRNINSPLIVEKSPIPRVEITPGLLLDRIKKILSEQPNIQTLEKAVEILQKKRSLLQRSRLPVIYLAGGVGYGLAPHREDQTNPFAVDDFNYSYVGAFMGVKWDLNRFRQNIDTRRNTLEQKISENRIILLKDKIQTDLFATLQKITENESLLLQSKKSLKAAKNWVRLALENWELGIGEVERIVKAYNVYYRLQGIVTQKEMELRTSLARFAFLLGKTSRYFEWIQKGEANVS